MEEIFTFDPLLPAPACASAHPPLPPPGQADQTSVNSSYSGQDPRIPLFSQPRVSPDQVSPDTEAERSGARGGSLSLSKTGSLLILTFLIRKMG